MTISDLTEDVLEKIRTIARIDQLEHGAPFTCQTTSKHVRDSILPWSLREAGACDATPPLLAVAHRRAPQWFSVILTKKGLKAIAILTLDKAISGWYYRGAICNDAAVQKSPLQK